MINKTYAITGGIGSGKSTVCQILKDMGFEVFSADEVYKELLKSPSFVKKIYTTLGINSDDYNNFNTKLVAEKVFNDKKLLSLLDNVTHPEIMRGLLLKSKEVNGLCFNEVPLLFESGYPPLYDGVIVVMRDINLRKNGVMSRDNISEEEFFKRVNNQFDYKNISEIEHTVITNDGDLEELKLKVKAVVNEIQKG